LQIFSLFSHLIG